MEVEQVGGKRETAEDKDGDSLMTLRSDSVKTFSHLMRYPFTARTNCQRRYKFSCKQVMFQSHDHSRSKNNI